MGQTAERVLLYVGKHSVQPASQSLSPRLRYLKQARQILAFNVDVAAVCYLQCRMARATIPAHLTYRQFVSNKQRAVMFISAFSPLLAAASLLRR